MSICLSVRRRFIFLTQFFSRATELFSTKPDTKHYWGKRFEVFLNEGPCLFLGEIIKIINVDRVCRNHDLLG